MPNCLKATPPQRHHIQLQSPSKTIDLDVEIAATDAQRRQGLMFRRNLEYECGMLFIYDAPNPVAMWMKNTPLSLDMLFFDQSGKIIHIQENTQPYSLKIIGPIKNTKYVLEIESGFSRRHELQKHKISLRLPVK